MKTVRRRNSLLVIALTIGAAASALSCGSGDGPTSAGPDTGPPTPDAEPPSTTAGVPAISGGTLAISRDGHLAIAADPDHDRVFIVDLDKKSSTFVELKPNGFVPPRNSCSHSSRSSRRI